MVDSRSGELLASYTLTTSSATFVDDVVVTKHAAWFTDSSQAQLYRLPLGRDGSLPTQERVQTVPLTGEWVKGDALGANGITQTPDREALLVVNTKTGLLYRVDPATGETTQVDVGGVSLERGDGMLLEGRTLYVVQNTMNKVAVIRLDRSGTAGKLTGYLRANAFDVPTTVARIAGALYLPNARFTTPDATQSSVTRRRARRPGSGRCWFPAPTRNLTGQRRNFSLSARVALASRPGGGSWRSPPGGELQDPGDDGPGGDPVRIVIAEDAVLFREGLARVLEDAGHEVVARVGDADAFVASVHKHRPDLVVVDIEMPPHAGDDGARAARGLREDFPELAIVLLSAHVETRHSVELVRAGRFGYLLKDRVLDVDDFLDALRGVGAGGTALDPEIVTELIGPRQPRDPLALLTPRQREVLSLMAEGRTNRGIARRLWLTDRTVETHVANVINKLGLHSDEEDNRRVLAVLAYLAGRATPS